PLEGQGANAQLEDDDDACGQGAHKCGDSTVQTKGLKDVTGGGKNEDENNTNQNEVHTELKAPCLTGFYMLRCSRYYPVRYREYTEEFSSGGRKKTACPSTCRFRIALMLTKPQ